MIRVTMPVTCCASVDGMVRPLVRVGSVNELQTVLQSSRQLCSEVLLKERGSHILANTRIHLITHY